LKVSSGVALGAMAIVVMLALPQSGRAFGTNYQKEASSGKPTRIFTFFNCMLHKPWYGTAFVEHGTVAYKQVTQKRCGNASEPAREVWYTSPPGYKGTDTVTFPIGSSSTVFNISVQ
jgi:hypothetical protein